MTVLPQSVDSMSMYAAYMCWQLLCVKTMVAVWYVKYVFGNKTHYSVHRPPSRRISAEFAEKTSLAENPPEKNAASRKSAE